MKSTNQPSREHHSNSAAGSKMQADSSPPEGNFPNDARFRLVFDRAPLGMAIVTLDFNVQQVNEALCSALGYTEEELIANNFMAITHPDDVAKGKGLRDKLLAGEIQSYRVEKRFITKQGALAWLDITVVLIRDSENNPLYALAMVENITERRRAFEALRTSEERYRSFVVNSSEAIWRFEVEQPIDITLPIDEQIALFYKHAYLAECNDAMARMYGHDRADDIVGLRFGDFGLAANPANISALRKFISHGYRLQDVETTELDADGTEKHISNNVIGIVINGQLLRMWGTQRDETERKRVEAEIRTSHAQLRLLAARLQSIREQERTQIAREMHDVLGQSLTSLKLDLSWLKKKLPANLSADVQERLEGMSNQIDETVVSVKTLSSELRPGVLDKFGLAAAVEWQCKEFERRTGIKCNARVPSDELALSNDISTAQFRILQESLSNVARHSEATDVQVELSLSDTQLILRISDNGTGISQAQINDAASLGLLGMRERAELLGGHFKIEPTGTGTITISNIPLSTPTISITPK